MADWEAFEKLEPTGTELENVRFGMVCATIMRAVTAIFWDKKKGKMPQYSPFDFFPSLIEEKKPQTAAEMAEKIKQIAEAFK